MGGFAVPSVLVGFVTDFLLISQKRRKSMWKVEDVKCDVARCIYNSSGHCSAKTVSISLTHDEVSEKEYIECDTMIIEK